MDVKVVSLNIWHGELLDDVVAFLHAQDADIVLLQEVANATDSALTRKHRSFSLLRQELGYEFADFAPALNINWPEGKVIEGNAIFSKFPITTAHPPIFFNEPFGDMDYNDPKHFPKAPRNLQHIEVKTPAGIVHILNLQGVWDLDGDNDSLKRRNMSRIILEQTKGLQRVIVAGDTNAKPTNPAMLALEEQLVSVFKDELSTSFNLRRKDLEKFPGYATATVDLMYVSPDVKVVAHDCPNIDVSDHLPLTATLTIS
ncbi:MAG TPA: endonuclease/exonuclease/phosphatase family protein [Magnetospirillaceae bacterium]|nr:endonuclease/exonuclease/phosphatase family protein [Magnetospirillaceae bacterium]